jgi:hypothetical protein
VSQYGNDTYIEVQIGSTTDKPEWYGEKNPLALKIVRGEPVPPAMHLEHTFIAAEAAIAMAQQLG